MHTVTLGMTGITVGKNSFGALPIQRISMEEATDLLTKAYEGGMRFFDTARAYSDSEDKLKSAFGDMREKVYISTKTQAKTGEAFNKDLDASLERLGYIDLHQFHNPPFCPKPGDGSGLYEAMLKAKEEGKVKHIGITSHRLHIAKEAIESGLYETLQFPFCYLSVEQDIELVRMCKERNMGFIAMKSLSGGLINNASAAYAYLAQYDNVLPIWGIQKESELEEFLSFNENPPTLTPEIEAIISADRKQLAGGFCRACGYCMPCPVGIEINTCARMSLLLRRSPAGGHLSEAGQAKMKKIEDCVHCNMCMSKCPYGLNTPQLLIDNYEDYKKVLAGEIKVTKD